MPYLTDMFHEQNRAPTDVVASPLRPVGAFDPTALTDRLGSRIVGQRNAIDAVVRAVSLASVGANDPSRPLANILLTGPTGVGKTELVRQVAAALRSGPDDMCRIDMNALAQEHYAASFSGAPPGYAGSKESFTLFDRGAIEGDPYTPGIVLFDEVEKADTTVLRALLQILDHGVLQLANGQQTISFRNSYVFLTSNLGSVELAARRRTLWGRRRRALLRSGVLQPPRRNRGAERTRRCDRPRGCRSRDRRGRTPAGQAVDQRGDRTRRRRAALRSGLRPRLRRARAATHCTYGTGRSDRGSGPRTPACWIGTTPSPHAGDRRQSPCHPQLICGIRLRGGPVPDRATALEAYRPRTLVSPAVAGAHTRSCRTAPRRHHQRH